MIKPVIGISSYAERARWAVWDLPATVVPQRYIDHVVAAGGAPMVLPLVADSGAVLADCLDGLLLIGGGDVDPVWYEAPRHPNTHRISVARDAGELALIDIALERQMPILGVCRGLQLLNVLRGGTLHQHLPDLVGHSRHALQAGAFSWHGVRLRADSQLGQALGRTELEVASAHHQAIDRLGAGMTATAWADDGVIEAAEVDGHPFAVGVQWHPEADNDPSLFTALVTAARARRAGYAPSADATAGPLLA